MHYLPSLFWVITTLHVSGLLVAHHQEVAMYIQYMTIGTCFTSWSTVGGTTNSRLRRTTRINCHIYTWLPPDDGLLESPKHVDCNDSKKWK
jgi:hypothetical protein